MTLATNFRGQPEQLMHDATCPKRLLASRPHFAPACICGEYLRDPELMRLIRPQGYVAYLEAVGQRRPVTPYVAQYAQRVAVPA